MIAAIATQQSDPGSLSRLHDIIEPAAVPTWPPATGWFVLLGVLAIVAIVFTWKAVARWRHNAYRRAGLTELERLDRDRLDPIATVTATSVLLKRVALAAFSRKTVAPLSGEAWVAFLDRTGGKGAFGSGPGKVLASLEYEAAPRLEAAQLEGLLRCARSWIRRHQPC